MENFCNYSSCILLFLGMFFCITGSLGIIRMPDVYSRFHAASITDSLGAPMILLGVILKYGFMIFSLKILILIFFLFITSSASAHAVARSALLLGEKYFKK